MSTARTSEEMTIIYKGATVGDLAQIFDMTPNDVNKRIVGNVPSVNPDHRVPRYRLRDAAPYLCNVVFDIEQFLKDMTPAKLPPALQDAFWKAQRTRQQFEAEQGELWSTQRVVEVFAEVFKTFRMTVMMFSDSIEQEVALSPQIRQILNEKGDALLDMAHKNLVAQFVDRVPADDEHGRKLKEADQVVISTNESAGYAQEEHEDEEFDDGFGD